jgi:hypothetical protein
MKEVAIQRRGKCRCSSVEGDWELNVAHTKFGMLIRHSEMSGT